MVFGPGISMTTLAFGDIHGCMTALQTLVDEAPYEHAELVVFLGDYVDRGPASAQVLDWLIDQQQMRPLVTLRGNHDAMMLAAREDEAERFRWLHFGGEETLGSYGPLATIDDVPAAHWEFLASTPFIYEQEHEFFVHANVEPRRPLDDQLENVLLWEKLHSPVSHSSGKRMICGHTAQHSGRPLVIGNTVCIDTWVYGDGWLTALDVENGKYWQANEAGEVRRGELARSK